MNCSVFRKKLNDFIEGNVEEDMKSAMEKHVKECDTCSNIYNKELAADDLFKGAFSIEDITFTSSRAEIMKSIDKNRYSKNLSNKLYFHFKKYTAKYISAAAIIIATAVFAPYVFKQTGHDLAQKQNKSTSIAQKADQNTGSASMNNAVSKSKSRGISDEKAVLDATSGYVPAFIKLEVSQNESKLQSNTPWVNSPSKKLSICIEGKGAKAEDEGVGIIFVKNLASGAMWKMIDMRNENKYSPKFAGWWDDKDALVVIGNAHGTVAKGGSLYLLNVETSAVSPVYVLQDNKTQVVSAKKVENNVQLQLLEYEDDALNKNRNEEIIFKTDMDALVKSNSEDRNAPEIKVIYDFQKYVNNKDYTSALKLLTESLKSTFTIEDEKPLKNIVSMNITKLEEKSDWGIDREEGKYYACKVYYAEVYYGVKDEEYSYIRNGIYYHKVVVAKEKKDSPWTIAELSASPTRN